jgi:guanylate kinase
MNGIDELIGSYEPSDYATELVQKTKIILLVGISGAGKDTIKKELLARPDFRDIVSHTTRPPRMNNGIMELPDVDYHFIDIAAAEDMLQRQQFI